MIRSPLRNAKPKLSKCRICATRFEKKSMAHIVCSHPCAQESVRLDNLKKAAKREQEERAATRVRKEAAKRRPDLIAEAQVAFNAFIRARDAGLPCICCGKPFEPQKPGGSADAGHYLSRGSSPHLRFNENNCFAQRKNCNRPGGTTRSAFRAGVVARIGLEAVEALEADNAVQKWSMDDLRTIKANYKAKLKQLKAGE